MQQAPLLGVSALAALAGAYVGYQLCQRRHSRRHRVAFVMELNGREHKCEYAKRHDGKDPHWIGPTGHLHRVMKESGVHNYSIHYLESTNHLFAYAELDEPDSLQRVAVSDECALWWRYFERAGLMRYNNDTGATKLGGATPWSLPLEEVFYMR